MRARQANAGPVKKLTIKPLRPPAVPQDFQEKAWGKLHAAVSAVHDKRRVESSLEELYRAVEDLCSNKLAATTHARLQEQCERHTHHSLRALVDAPHAPSTFLPLMQAVWADHCQQMMTIRALYLYLDRTYLLQTPGVRPIWEMGLQQFRHHLTSLPEVLPRTIDGVLDQLERERSGELVDRGLLHNLTRMFSALQLYAERFEGPLISRCTSFYAAESTRVLAASGVADYLRHAEARLEEEGARAHACLHQSSRKPLLAAVHATLIQPHTEALIEKGLDTLLLEGRTEDLRRMYILFGAVGAHKQLKDAWAAHIKRVGAGMVTDSDPEREKTLVQDLLDLKARCDAVHAAAFEKSEPFGYALREAFESFINVKQNRPAELIAKFLDAQLRSSPKAASEDDLETTLDRAMTLFRFINGKDMFEAFYKKDLARRLLLGRSSSTDAEKLLISKLKAECGAGFTNKLEGMFKDIDLSADIMAAFRDAQDAGRVPKSDVDISVHVLTTGFWPPYPPAELKVPKHLADLQDTFAKFYLAKHSGRRITWAHALGHCIVKAHFPLAPQGSHELQLSLLQAVTLLLFNDTDEASLEQIADATGIEDKELRLTLQSLACGKVRVLTKEPKGRDVEDGDRFIFNAELSHKYKRIKVNSIQLKESPEENEATTERVFIDRQYQIDAAIVRVMKSRKALSHTLLLNELYAQLKFPLKPQDLKKRIESLIDREYLERDSKNTQMYRYLA